MTRLYYVVQSEMLTGGVIESQILAALRAQAAAPGQPPTTLVFLEPLRVAWSRAARRTLRFFRGLWPQGRIVLLPFVGRLGGERAPAYSLLSYLRWRERDGADLVFHCRGSGATWTAHLARRALGRGRVIFDLRGHHPFETIHRLGHPDPASLPPAVERSYRLTLQRERQAAAAADQLFTVSPGLVTYAVEDLGVPAERVLVVPNC